MGKIIALLLIFIIVCALWSLPLYLCANFLLWLFHIEFHLTWLQSFGICLMISVLKSLISRDKGGN